MRPQRAFVLVIGAAVVALALLGGRSLRTGAMDRYLATQRYEDVYYLPPAEWLPVLSLGYDEALADLFWSRALIYFGDELVHRGQVAHVFEYADAIIALDPDFKPVYRWVGTSGMYRPTGVGVEEIRRSTEYLERAARRFPDDGVMAWDAGASLAFELAPHVEDPEEKDRVRARGVEYMQTAARLGAGPEWLVFTNATYLRRLGQTEQAIRHLEEMYATVRDEETRRQIAAELEQLRSAAHAEAFRQAHEELEGRRRRDFPYVGPTLHQLLGPRPPVAPYGLIERGFLPEERVLGDGGEDVGEEVGEEVGEDVGAP